MAGLDLKKYKETNKPKQPTTKEKQAGGSFDFLNRDISLFGNKFSNKSKETFYLETSSMLSAGMNLKNALELLVNQQEKQKEKEILDQVKQDLINGHNFSDSLKHSGHFTPYEYFSVQIGEETGQLDTVLAQLADYYAKRSQQSRQLMSSLSYPIVIMLSSIGAVAFMLGVIVPMFSDVFKRFGSELPPITKALISASGFLGDNFLWLLMILLGLVGVYFYFKDNVKFKAFRQTAFHRLPFIGQMLRSIYLSRFCISMALLTGAKVPLIKSIGLVSEMIDYAPIQRTLPNIEKDILQGKALNVSMGQFSVYDKKMVALIKVGEEVNQLELFFEKLHKRFSDDVDLRTSVINTFLEPLIIIFLGLVIGVVLVAMYLPMFKLSTSIG